MLNRKSIPTGNVLSKTNAKSRLAKTHGMKLRGTITGNKSPLNTGTKPTLSGKKVLKRNWEAGKKHQGRSGDAQRVMPRMLGLKNSISMNQNPRKSKKEKETKESGNLKNGSKVKTAKFSGIDGTGKGWRNGGDGIV